MAKGKQIFSTIVVLFILVGLPGISYIYLKNGYAYRKEIIATMEDHGEMPDLSGLTAVRGTYPVNPRGAMTMVGWLDPTKPATARRYGTMLDSLYRQFEESPNLYFTTIVKGADAETTARTFANEHNLPADKMLSFLAADEGAFRRSAGDFSLPQPDLVGETPIVALVDSSLTIVRYYDLDRREETIGLVQLIASIIPLKERPDLILERKQEL